MGAMSLLTHSQMGLGIGALGVPELRRIPSGQLGPPRLKEDCNKNIANWGYVEIGP